MKIMIVDDHADMRRMIKSIILISCGNNVEIFECESGEEAVIQFPVFKPTCILMDIQLINMTGLEAAEQILQQDPKASIVMVTGHNSTTFRERANSLAIVDYISKENLSRIGPLLTSLNS
jgi:two-component system LytT family response regulator